MPEGLYEQVAAHGAGHLLDAELVQVLLRSGSQSVSVHTTVAALLGRYPRFLGLSDATVAELTQLRGIGLSKAVGLVAGIEFGRRVVGAATTRFGTVTSTQALAKRLIREWRGLVQERVVAILLDNQLQVIQEVVVALGGRDSAAADPRVVFATALRQNATALILVHNHPGKTAQPSHADVAVTKRFAAAGEVLGVRLLDHLVIGDPDYYSFAQHDNVKLV